MKNYIIIFYKLVNHLKIKQQNFVDYSRLKNWYSMDVPIIIRILMNQIKFFLINLEYNIYFLKIILFLANKVQ